MGLHEFSHIIQKELEIEQEVGWYTEFMANYIAHAFIQQLPREAKLNNLITDAFFTNLKPTEKHFGGLFRGTSDNYVWWQASMQKRINELFPKTGLAFLQQLANLRNSQQYFDDLTMLVALEEIGPGFLSWAKQSGHITNADNKKIDEIGESIKSQVGEASAKRASLYTFTYSAKWTTGDNTNADIVMKLLKSQENETVDTSMLAVWVNYANQYKRKEQVLSELNAERQRYENWKISVSSIIPVKSTDRNESWVIVYGTIKKKDLQANYTSTDVTQWYKINKDKKIEFIKEFHE